MAEMTKTKINKKWEIILPKHRAERPEYHLEDGWENRRLVKLESVIKSQEKPTVYYVGAEEGEMPALCQIWGATVKMFEPNPKVWPNIKAIWQANKLKPPMTYCGFASNTEKIVDEKNLWNLGFPTYADDEVIGNHGFKELYLEADNYNQTRIDNCTDIYPPTIISIDVEGSEWRVLEGAEETLRQFKPKIFLSGHPEFMFHQWGEYLSDLRGWIKNLGYKETLLDYQHEVHLYYE